MYRGPMPMPLGMNVSDGMGGLLRTMGTPRDDGMRISDA